MMNAVSNAYELIQSITKHGAVIYADAGKVKVRGVSKLPTPLLEQLKERRDDVLAVLTVPRLPWQLERLLDAASSGALTVSVRGVPDTSRYVMACSYLASSQRDEPLKRLWEVYELWQQTKN
jgi:hypothetical protein